MIVGMVGMVQEQILQTASVFGNWGIGGDRDMLLLVVENSERDRDVMVAVVENIGDYRDMIGLVDENIGGDRDMIVPVDENIGGDRDMMMMVPMSPNRIIR